MSGLGDIDVAWGSTSCQRFALNELTDSTDLLRGDCPDFEEIRARLARDGYVFLRGLLGEDKVNAARRRIVRYLARLGMVDTEHGGDSALDLGRMVGGKCRGITLSGATVTRTEEVVSLLEGGGGGGGGGGGEGSGALGLEAFFEGLFRGFELREAALATGSGGGGAGGAQGAGQGTQRMAAAVGVAGSAAAEAAAAAVAAAVAAAGATEATAETAGAATATTKTTTTTTTARKEAYTFETKWMRVMGGGESTSAHSDAYFFDCNRGGEYPGLLTCWTPLGDAPIESGPLAVCSGTHALPGFAVSPGDAMVPPDEVRQWGSVSFTLGCPPDLIPSPPDPTPPDPTRSDPTPPAAAGLCGVRRVGRVCEGQSVAIDKLQGGRRAHL